MAAPAIRGSSPRATPRTRPEHQPDDPASTRRSPTSTARRTSPCPYSVVNQSDSHVRPRARLRGGRPLRRRQRHRARAFFDPGPPRQVGGINQSAGSSGRLVEQTPWSHYQEGRVQRRLRRRRQHRPDAPGLQRHDRSRRSLDNGVGVQWDFPTPALTLAPAGDRVQVDLALQATSRRCQLTLLAATQGARADRDRDRRGPQRRRQPRSRAARCATRSPARTRAPAP